jgi:dCTP deaminase
MTILSDRDIAELAWQGMITPFCPIQVKVKQMSLNGYVTPHNKIISYGLSSYGYDIRLAPEFKLFTNLKAGVIDPKDFDEDFLVSIEADEIIIPPNSFALGRSVEYFHIPRDLTTIVIGKSTYARCAVIVNVTALEPEWEGNVTIEISNTAPLPVKIYANEGICQVMFFRADKECEVSYKDKRGKYQGQTGITLAK